MRLLWLSLLLSLFGGMSCAQQAPPVSCLVINNSRTGTCIETHLALQQKVDASKAKPGDIVIAKAIVTFESEDRRLKIPKGSKVLGKVVLATSRVNGDKESALAIVFDSAIQRIKTSGSRNNQRLSRPE